MSKATFQGYTKEEWRKIKQIIAPILHIRPKSRLTRRAITHLQRATNSDPNEWVYWYALGDYYQRLELWDLSIEACQRCYNIRPNDPRSPYALATAYRFWAQGHERYTTTGQDIAQRAFDLFSQVLDTPIPKYQKFLVKRTLTALTKKYPDLISIPGVYRINTYEPPPPRPSLVRRFFNAYRLGKLVVLALVILASLGLLSNNLDRSPDTSQATTNVITVTKEVLITVTPRPPTIVTLIADPVAIEPCIHWTKARNRIGQNTCVYGNVTSTYNPSNAFFINFTDDRTAFYATSLDWTWSHLEGNCVIVYGVIEAYKGRPQIVIRDRDQLTDCYR